MSNFSVSNSFESAGLVRTYNVQLRPEQAKLLENCRAKIVSGAALGALFLGGASAYGAYCLTPSIDIAPLIGLVGATLGGICSNAKTDERLSCVVLGLLGGLSLGTAGYLPAFTATGAGITCGALGAVIGGTLPIAPEIFNSIRTYTATYKAMRNDFAALDVYLKSKYTDEALNEIKHAIREHIEMLYNDLDSDACVTKNSNLWKFLTATIELHPLDVLLLLLSDSELCSMLKELQNSSNLNSKSHFEYLIQLITLRIQACFPENTGTAQAFSKALETSSSLPSAGFPYLLYQIDKTEEFGKIKAHRELYQNTIEKDVAHYIDLLKRHALHIPEAMDFDTVDWEAFLNDLFRNNVFHRSIEHLQSNLSLHQMNDRLIDGIMGDTCKFSVATFANEVEVKVNVLALGEGVLVLDKEAVGKAGYKLTESSLIKDYNINTVKVAEELVSIVGKQLWEKCTRFFESYFPNGQTVETA